MPDGQLAATEMSFASVAKWLPNEQARLLREWLASHPKIPLNNVKLAAACSSSQVQDGKQGAAGTTPTTIVVGMLHLPGEMLVRPWCLLTGCHVLDQEVTLSAPPTAFCGGAPSFLIDSSRVEIWSLPRADCLMAA
jgi:hypothetical protein